WKNKNQKVIFTIHLKVHQKTHLLRKIIDFGHRGCENEKDDGGMRCKKSERERERDRDGDIVIIHYCYDLMVSLFVSSHRHITFSLSPSSHSVPPLSIHHSSSSHTKISNNGILKQATPELMIISSDNQIL